MTVTVPIGACWTVLALFFVVMEIPFSFVSFPTAWTIPRGSRSHVFFRAPQACLLPPRARTVVVNYLFAPLRLLWGATLGWHYSLQESVRATCHPHDGIPGWVIPSCAAAMRSALRLVLLGGSSRLYATSDSRHEPLPLVVIRMVEAIEGVAKPGSWRWWRLAGPR